MRKGKDDVLPFAPTTRGEPVKALADDALVVGEAGAHGACVNVVEWRPKGPWIVDVVNLKVTVWGYTMPR